MLRDVTTAHLLCSSISEQYERHITEKMGDKVGHKIGM